MWHQFSSCFIIYDCFIFFLICFFLIFKYECCVIIIHRNTTHIFIKWYRLLFRNCFSYFKENHLIISNCHSFRITHKAHFRNYRIFKIKATDHLISTVFTFLSKIIQCNSAFYINPINDKIPDQKILSIWWQINIHWISILIRCDFDTHQFLLYCII